MQERVGVNKSRRKAQAGAPWKARGPVLHPGPLWGAVSWCTQQPRPRALLQSLKLQRGGRRGRREQTGGSGRLFLEAKFCCLQAGERKPEANRPEIAKHHRWRSWKRGCRPALPFTENRSVEKAERSSAQDPDSQSFPGLGLSQLSARCF